MVSVAELAAPCDHPDLSLSYRSHLGLPGGQEDALTRARLEVTSGVLQRMCMQPSAFQSLPGLCRNLLLAPLL
ncbi:rCG38692, isoform CRA_e [Rattus norvegicus]|uniref:RCG38692, isoform CRA_e n=1 Tax=Rattus norvegicus TaxID=10116 RepID=A6KA78_RAT|nr:rCG38692, isoform CRA_e [Rattus norvegicus]